MSVIKKYISMRMTRQNRAKKKIMKWNWLCNTYYWYHTHTQWLLISHIAREEKIQFFICRKFKRKQITCKRETDTIESQIILYEQLFPPSNALFLRVNMHIHEIINDYVWKNGICVRASLQNAISRVLTKHLFSIV